MQRSTDRILTTHVGSLPRPLPLIELMRARLEGQHDAPAFAAAVREAVAAAVEKQAALGIDVIDDGEQSKTGFVAYVNERLSGFEPAPGTRSAFEGSREFLAFPEFYHAGVNVPGASRVAIGMVCTGPIAYRREAVETDIANLKAALAGKSPAEVFMPAAAPASVEGWQQNRYYKSAEEFVFAIAEAMREEYLAIVDAGFVLQIDDPFLVTHYVKHPEKSVAECRAWAELRVEALNHALRGIPPEQVRHHTCYGINMGPRVHDMEMKDILDIALKINAGAYSFEAANPRHEHEWRLWESVILPEGKAIIPGVISHTTLLVEHPELVAERIRRYAGLVGRENVIAGADCGFASQASATPEIHPSIVWAKLGALVEGARLASRQLWGKAARTR